MIVGRIARACALVLLFAWSLALPEIGLAQKVTPAAAFRVRTFNWQGYKIDQVVAPGRPPKYRVAAVNLREARATGAVLLPNVPAFDWSYGCSATAGAMLAGYYDGAAYPAMYTGPTNGGLCPPTNAVWGTGECPLSATHQGYDNRGSRGHVDDYWVEYDSTATDPYQTGGWAEHAQADCTGDFMGTNQDKYGNSDSSTAFYFMGSGQPLVDYTGSEPNGRDGCHGLRLFVESRDYRITTNFNQYIQGYNGNTAGFTFEDYMAEIDAGRPVVIQVAGHSMLGFGYNTSGNLVYLHDTWDYADHEMIWGDSYAGMQHFGVTVLRLQPVANRSPAANNLAIATDENAPVNITLTGTDPDGDPLTFTVTFQPENGVLTGTAPYLTYSPDAGYAGPDGFTFRVSDGRGGADTGTVNITVTPLSNPRVALDDTYRMVWRNRLVISAPGVLENDADIAGLAVILVDGAHYGRLRLNANGSFTYTPGRMFLGTDYFTYQVTDGQDFSNVAVVYIQVNPR